MKRLRFLDLVIFSISVLFLSGFLNIIPAENDPEKEILVYFTSGVDRAAKGEVSAQIGSMIVKNTLANFNIGEDKITSAFPDFSESDTLIKTLEGRTVGLPNMAKIFRIQVPDDKARESVIDSLKKLPNVLFAEVNGRISVDLLPNDQNFSYQWEFQAGSSVGKICAPEAWDIFQGSSSIKIAIIDEGVDRTHPDLNGKVSGQTTVYGYHGTHVADTAAAQTNNNTGVAGVDWNAQILAKAFNDGTEDGDPYIYQIVTEAVNEGSHVLNNSWKLLNKNGTPGRYSTTVRIAFAYAYKQNRIAVATIGNTGNTTNTVQYPGSFGQGIIAIGATDQSDVHANFSTYGSAIDVAAPGVSILSTFRNGVTFSDPNYEYISGTSMAAPHVTGIASLLKGYNSSLYNDDIEHIIQISADDITTYPATTGWDQYTGYGRVNAKKALDYLCSPYTINHLTASGGYSYSSTGTYTATMLGVEGLSDGVYIVKRYEVRKSVNFGQVFQSSPYVWGRGVVTNGFSAANPNFGMGWCDKVSSTNSSATLKTYIYKVWTISGTYLGWFPTTVSNITWAYTVLGVPVPLSVTISGPTYLSEGETGTFTANPSGGSGTYTNYQWWYRYDGEIEPLEKSVPSAKLPPVGTWYYLEDREGDQSITFGPSYNFSLKCTVTDSKGSTATDVHTAIVEGLTLDLSIPDQLTVSDNSPNPFNLVTTIKYGIPESGLATITIYSITGQKVKTLVNDHLSAGYHQVQWNGTNNFGSEIASGLYILELKSGSDHVMKKLMFAK
ncbi:MAG TPA: S8 family serine peptidase [Candidatus Marinimicrobia bacterium]|nr:S8 family serine peptidase [Candidatus Neomarinimicrobiota bacterium]HQK11124.1 S8 family serine peptidase [Candidatus Neomarinimicrobiota bacterium]